MSDRVSITAGRELSDKVINAAMLLLSKQYGHVDGMQDCTLGHYSHFTPINQTLAIQIFHTGEQILQNIASYMYVCMYVCMKLSYNTGKNALPDIIICTTPEGAQSPRASAYLYFRRLSLP